MAYRIGGMSRGALIQHESAAEHQELVLRRAAGYAMQELDLHFGGSLDRIDAFLRETMSFSVVIPSQPPALSPEIKFREDFRPTSRERVRIADMIHQAVEQLYPVDKGGLGMKEGSSTELTASTKLARAMLDLADGVATAREAQSLSVEDLAARAGVDATDIDLPEEGDLSDISVLLRVIDALNAAVQLTSGYHVSVGPNVAA